MGVSVLVCTYVEDQAVHLATALRSICEEQTRPPDQVVLVCDGALTDALDQVIEQWRRRALCMTMVNVVRLPHNQGLAEALNIGLGHCRHDLVVRMDADDVALPHRIERQVAFMAEHPEIVAASGPVEEMDGDGRILGMRKLPRGGDVLRRFARRRNPISHPAVIMRRDPVMAVGGYPRLRKAQDYGLWSRLLVGGYLLANDDEVTLRMRTGNSLLQRRGVRYLRHELSLLRYQYRIGFLSGYQFLENALARIVVRTAPEPLKRWMYRRLR